MGSKACKLMEESMGELLYRFEIAYGEYGASAEDIELINVVAAKFPEVYEKAKEWRSEEDIIGIVRREQITQIIEKP
jgi:hypothetical protein